MDPGFSETPHTVSGLNFDDDDDSYFPSYAQSENIPNGIQHDHLDLDVLDNFAPSSTVAYELESPDDQDSDPVLKFLNQILFEEDMDDKPSMFHHPLALRAAEKSLYEVIGQEYPLSPRHRVNYVDQPSYSPDSVYGVRGDAGISSIDPPWILDPGEYNSSVDHGQEFSSNSLLQVGSQSSSFGTVNGSKDERNNSNLLQNIFSDSESILQFKRGMEEASKFLPTSNPLIIDLDKYELPRKSDDVTPSTVLKFGKDEYDDSTNGSKGRKHYYPYDGDSEDLERSSKQSTTYVDDTELSEMFDRVLLCTDAKGEEGPMGPNGSNAHAKKNPSTEDTLDLSTLLINCAQSVAGGDRRTVYEQLKQISLHASPTGDAYQRLASVFVAGLHTRLGGIGTELYRSRTRRSITAAEKLKAYQVYLSACPFKKLSIFFANKMIAQVASDSEATTLHIIDFGILYGFQWPVLIQLLSQRPGGPPKLRITGIEIPQPGFRPSERVEETGFRLATYCERFGVPFEYQVVASRNWETVKIEDLKIVNGEVVAVNCLFRFGRLLDETVVPDSPRDAVLRLITQLNPAIFVNAVTSGSYSAPFFVTRFREALFHYSALFDMFDATLPRENPSRMIFEQEFYGSEVINVIACEGIERVERPETYKQWQLRHMRAGFKPFPLNPEIMDKLKHKAMAGYHKDFLFDEDGNWMIQGWKGRILYASSCWVAS